MLRFIQQIKWTQLCWHDGLTENAGHEFDRHENEGQDIQRLKIDYITMQCAIVFKTTQNASPNSKISCIICICIIGWNA